MSDRYRLSLVLREAGRATRRGIWAGLVAAGLSGCSFMTSDVGDDGPESTGSISRAADVPTLSPELGQEDWRRARSALAVALDPQGSGSTVKWDNPDTEISGSFTPVAQPFVRSNEICRAFLASLAFPGRTVSLQGTGCRIAGEDWRLEGIRPWHKPA